MADPHIHVETRVAQAGADYRNLIAATFGAVPDAPAEVTTGCGLQVPYATTSPHPERVTCLPCREHARREYLAFAEQVANLSRLPGAPVSAEDAATAVRRLRELAERYGQT
ncbi:hypothetical protein [Actinophytocola glycyrrhizae]|uniref:Uncharacterized protein n=1 Tax=Actinophytocola glycyrrhizae TaxID=2044873 RepID=A0ABV9RXM7_9PSEU